MLFVASISFVPAFALDELERASISDPKLVTPSKVPIGNNVNVGQQILISADITNNQDESQNFVYLVQIKDKTNFVVSFGWFSGKLNPHQTWNTSVFWTPDNAGEFTAEIFLWEALINHKALTEYTTLQINVS
ncbi:MAG: hypothetical protein V3R39_01905 [Nitrosopumilus sp.]